MICQICQREVKRLQAHLTRSHPTIILKEYYNQYLIPSNFNKECPIQSDKCKGEKIFTTIKDGYMMTCGAPKCAKLLSGKTKSERIKNERIDLTDVVVDKQYIKTFIKKIVANADLSSLKQTIRSKYHEEYKQILKLNISFLSIHYHHN